MVLAILGKSSCKEHLDNLPHLVMEKSYEIQIYFVFPKINTAWQGLTHKQLKVYGCVLSAVATDVLVLKYQAISIHNAD